MQYRIIHFYLFVGLSTSVHAISSSCLQDPERLDNCPHLIYKKAALPVVLLDVNKGDVICICLTDFKALGGTTAYKAQQVEQQISFKRVTQKYQLSEQDILILIRN
jgi:hypothetical protein